MYFGISIPAMMGKPGGTLPKIAGAVAELGKETGRKKCVKV